MRIPTILLATLLPLATLLAASPAGAGFRLVVPGDHATIGAALLAAVADDTVAVAAGTFAPSTNGETYPLQVPDGVVLVGAGAGMSILDAEGTARVIELTGSGAACVRGFTLTGGVADRGGGVFISAGTHEVSANLIIDCGALVRGSGLNVEGNAAPDVHHNVIWQSFDADLGDSGDPHGSQWGGSATGRFRQNLVGRGDSNGLFVIEQAAPEVSHNIFFENGDGVRGRGICFTGDPSTVIAYNLFWGNTISALVMRNLSGSFVNVDAVTANGLDPADGVYGNLDADPLLVDADALDFALTATSPAIDAGEPGTGTDPDGTVLDLGPLYFDQATTAVAPARPGAARLAAVTPNPFNPRTVVLLELQRAGDARITIHDARGRRVRALFTGFRDAGTHPLSFDGLDDEGRPLASGVYFARLEALGSVDVRSMVLVR